MTNTLRPTTDDGPIIPGTRVEYDFPDMAGRLQLRKVRWQTEGGRGKTFRMRSRRLLTDGEKDDLRRKYGKVPEFNVQLKFAQRWQPGSRHCPNAHELLYGLPQMMQAMADGERTIYWCEGEKDVNSMREKAGVVAVSHWQGAGNATSEQASWFAPFGGHILLVADWDPPGAADVLYRWRLLLELGIPEERIQLVRAHGPHWPGKDITDHLERYTVDQLVEIKIYNRELHAAAKQFIEERGERGGFAY